MPSRSMTWHPISSWTQSTSWSPSSASPFGAARSTSPASSSACSRVSTPSKATIHRWRCGWDRSTTSVRVPASSIDPGARRDGSVLVRLTSSSPRNPWGLVMRPTSRSGCSSSPLIGSPRSVEELDVDLDAVAHGGCPRDGADRGGHPAPLADDPTHVAFADGHVQRGAPAALLDLDLDGVGIVHDRPHEVVEHAAGVPGRDRVGIVVDGVAIDVVVIVVELVVVDGVAVDLVFDVVVVVELLFAHEASASAA